MVAEDDKLQAIEGLPAHRTESGDGRWWFDLEAANRIINFYPRYLRHVLAEWAGRPFYLDAWQQVDLGNIFGWKSTENDKRRYDSFYMEIPRKNGKSGIASGVAIYLTGCDGEPGARVVAAATTRKQAGEVYNSAAQMVRTSTPGLRKRAIVGRDKISFPKSFSWLEVISGDGEIADGMNLSGAIVDELHAHKDGLLLDVIETSMGARREPMLGMITTAGRNPYSICGEIHERVIKINQGLLPEEGLYGRIYCASKEDDPGDPLVWAKANPGLGTSVGLDYLKKKWAKAQAIRSFYNTFLRLHLNVWTNDKEGWIPVHIWRNAAAKTVSVADGSTPTPAYSIEEFYRRKVWIAIDLSKTTDLTAACIVYQTPQGKFRIKLFFWMPEETYRERCESEKGIPWEMWVKDGFITVTPGAVVDYDFIEHQVTQWAKMFEIQRVGFDPWHSEALQTRLTREMGVRWVGKKMEPIIVEVRQGYKTLSPAMKDVEGLIKSRALEHDDNPVMSWMMSNVVIDKDPQENIKPNKAKSSNRIDGPVSMIMAISLALQDIGGSDGSIYNERGLIAL